MLPGTESALGVRTLTYTHILQKNEASYNILFEKNFYFVYSSREFLQFGATFLKNF